MIRLRLPVLARIWHGPGAPIRRLAPGAIAGCEDLPDGGRLLEAFGAGNFGYCAPGHHEVVIREPRHDMHMQVGDRVIRGGVVWNTLIPRRRTAPGRRRSALRRLRRVRCGRKMRHPRGSSCASPAARLTPVSMAVLLGMATIRRCAEVVVAPGPDPRPLGGRTRTAPSWVDCDGSAVER